MSNNEKSQPPQYEFRVSKHEPTSVPQSHTYWLCSAATAEEAMDKFIDHQRDQLTEELENEGSVYFNVVRFEMTTFKVSVRVETSIHYWKA